MMILLGAFCLIAPIRGYSQQQWSQRLSFMITYDHITGNGGNGASVSNNIGTALTISPYSNDPTFATGQITVKFTSTWTFIGPGPVPTILNLTIHAGLGAGKNISPGSTASADCFVNSDDFAYSIDAVAGGLPAPGDWPRGPISFPVTNGVVVVTFNGGGNSSRSGNAYANTDGTYSVSN